MAVVFDCDLRSVNGVKVQYDKERRNRSTHFMVNAILIGSNTCHWSHDNSMRERDRSELKRGKKL